MKKLLFALPLLIIIFAYFFWPETVITYPPGITAPTVPQQTNLDGETKWSEDEYTIEALAEYNIKARVLSIWKRK